MRPIAEVHVAGWRAAYRGLVPDEILARLDVGERADAWRRLIGDAIVLVADVEGTVVGFVAVPAGLGEVAALYVAPDRFRQGIGTRLLAAAHDALRANGHAEATVWVFAGNHAARAFYAAHGYAPDGATGEQLGLPTVRLWRTLHTSGKPRPPG